MFKYFYIRTLNVILPFVPYYIIDFIGKISGTAIYRSNNWRTSALLKNAENAGIGEVLPEEVFQNMVINFLDFFKSTYLNKKYLQKISDNCAFNSIGFDLNQQFILATGHLGNWDLAGVYIGSIRGNFVTVAESKGPGERLFKLFSKMRGKTGMKVLRLEDQFVAVKMEKYIKLGYSPVLLIDRDIAESGINLTFGNAKASVPKGAYYFSKRYGIPILIAGYVRIKDLRYRYKVICAVESPVQNSREASESVINKFVKIVKQYPNEWTAFDMRWEV